ncbi:MAG TPA: HEAT repeat domain-containing protein [Candidatus Bathyarchaeia archaeon]|nr:HEAT repeat domain-containing protein [Candidatus Bathyarchaeia archaeon]
MRILPLLLVALAASRAAAQGFEPPTPEELAAREKVRPAVEAIWREVRTPPEKNADPRPRYFYEVTDSLIALGPGVVPFLIAEIDLDDSNTFHFAAYALGRLGGPGVEEALRKALRRADDRGGRYGQQSKRMALYALAMLGQDDTIDLMQEGEEVPGTNVIPDMYLMPQVALMLGPAAVPRLLKQLDAYAADPASSTKLEWTLRGLGRAGDTSVAPRIVPLLSSASIGVRAQAEEALGRIADGSVCDKLVPLLANAKLRENQSAALALARIRPEACVPAIVDRLKIEPNIEVRAQLYRAIASVQGEAALEALQPYLATTNPYEPTILLDTMARIGSRKALPMVRSLLDSKNGGAVQRALETLVSLGGEGAVDTLLARANDSRRTVRLLACRNLVELRERRAGPRVAANLLEMVGEPVGNLSERAPIKEYAEALVLLRYTDPIPALQEAAAKQSDPEIVASLSGAVVRLKLLAELGDDVSKWAARLTDPSEPVRALAADRLAEIGGHAAVAALEKRLSGTSLPPDERAAILTSIGQFHPEGAASLVERHLSDPAYDPFALRDTRIAAAWAARRIGGTQMVKALRASAVRRDGRDFATLAYLAIADPTGAAPTIKTARARRLRYPEPTYGRDDEHLDEILRDLSRGKAPRRFDVPPVNLPTL